MDNILEQLFIAILNMSLAAGVIILAVILIRLLLKKVPRIFSYALWVIVLFRLLCPFSFSSAFSLLGFLRSEPAIQGRMTYIPENIGYQMTPTVNLPIPALNDMVNGSLPAGNPQGSVNPLQLLLFLYAWLWVLGVFLMAAYSVISMLRLRKRLKRARWERENIYRMDETGTPCVCGLIKPRIYLPSGLQKEEENYILLHEQIHIRRKDHIFRLLSWLALCLHWFNPLAWIAFSLSEKDMEMSCDEAVIRESGQQTKKEYSASLLAAAAVLCIILAVILLANPQNKDDFSKYEDLRGKEIYYKK